MILTTTYAENYGREEIHKTLVQMADVAVPANESDVLWRHATFEEAVAYLVAIAVVLETYSKELFAIVSVFAPMCFTLRLLKLKSPTISYQPTCWVTCWVACRVLVGSKTKEK